MPDTELKATTHVCPWWLCYTFDNPLRRLVHRPEKLLAPYLQEGGTALDVGCGMGYFSLGMARLVGSSGRVIAVDLQEKMLAVLKRRAARAGLADRILTRRCAQDSLGAPEPVDFALTFWMAHEAPDVPGLLQELRGWVKPEGRYLLVEPRWHVPTPDFRRVLEAAQAVGFKLLDRPRVGLSRAALFG